MSQFAKDVNNGLSKNPKELSSKYFYDAKGDILFQNIMAAPEYYLTKTEYSILNENKELILDEIKANAFNLVELGAGDGYKTKLLLNHFVSAKADFTYYPIDISEDVLINLKVSLKTEIPELKTETLNLEYFSALKELSTLNSDPKLVLFLGSNIGNFKSEQAIEFFKGLKQNLNKGDLVLVGVDLKKDPQTILNAYNDSEGVTAEFNLNLLDRINKELGGDFNRNNFYHYPTYNPLSGETFSFIVSKYEQTVFIKQLNKSYKFSPGEPIHTEISRKYSLSEVEELAAKSTFKVKRHFTDPENFFVNSLWEID